MNPWEEKEYGLVDEVIDDGKPGLVAPIGKINGRSRVAAKPGKIFHPSSRYHGMVMLEAKAMRTRVLSKIRKRQLQFRGHNPYLSSI